MSLPGIISINCEVLSCEGCLKKNQSMDGCYGAGGCSGARPTYETASTQLAGIKQVSALISF